MGDKSSRENYLETILMLSGRQASAGRDGRAISVRAVDIAKELEFSKPSVSVAMKRLRAEGYVEIDGSGYITLTPSGLKIAETMYERHVLISDWLIYLGVDGKTAVADACPMEHDISEQSFTAIKKHISGLRTEGNFYE